MQNAELELLYILHRNDAEFTLKLLTLAVCLEKAIWKRKKQPAPTPTKAKG